MKRIKFKNPFNGIDNAKKLIPESYKTDGNEFEMTDGNETYRVKWESSINEATVLKSGNKSQINEDMQKMKHLMGYSSKETLGTVKGTERLEENTKFNDILGKTKNLLSENGVAGGMQGFAKEGNLVEEDVIEEGSGDVDNLLKTMSDNAPVAAAGKKINTNIEKIDATVELGKKITNGDETLMSKAGRQLKDAETSDAPEDTSMTNEGEDDLPEAPSHEETDANQVYEEKDRFDEIFDGYDNDADEDDSIVEDDVETVV